jgi:hypothetical protein
MSEVTNDPVQAENSQIEVTDLDHFVQLLTRWHARKVKNVQHLLSIPDGFIVQIGEAEEFEVTGDIHKGFLLGIELALMEFGALPFQVEMEDAPAEPEPTEAS